MPALASNEAVIKRLHDRWQADRLAHAYLFIAPKNSGKCATAVLIAQLVNCQAPQIMPCGQCASCMKIASGNHPDVMIVAKDEETLKVEHIRSVLSRAQLRAYEAQVKVFILPDAERMTTEAANAFLKTLEEPAPKTLMLLTTSRPEHLLDTVKSRCQWVRFAPAKTEEHIFTQEFLTSKQEIIATLFVQGISDDDIKEYTDDENRGREVLAVLTSLIRDVFVLHATGDETRILNRDQRMQVRDLSRYDLAQLTDILRQVKAIKVQIDEHLNAKMAWQILKERLWNTLSKSS